MPELPEVETVARSLAPQITGATLAGATIYWPRTLSTPLPAELGEQIAGRRIEWVGRRGKYVVLGLDRGYLLFHLKMTGRLAVVPADEPEDFYTRAVFTLADGRRLLFRDVRKFGRVYLVEHLAVVTGRLGPEPLSPKFTAAEFCRLMDRRSGRLKSLLLNQEFLAGLGNIYSDEVLFAARLHPLRPARSLTAEERERLYHAVRGILARAIDSGGTTLADRSYLDALGQAGAFQEEVAVYQRTGRPCPVCGSAIERIIVGGRSTHFCPHCQT